LNSAGGIILDFAVQTIGGIAVFQPVMNGKQSNSLNIYRINVLF